MAQRAKTAKKTTKKKTTKKKTARKTAAKSSKKTSKKTSSAERTKLPRVGQTVTWHALPGDVEGKVIAILREDSTLNGKKVKASPDSPRIKLRSSASGKICVHRPENIHIVR